MATEVMGKKMPTEFVRPVISLVDHRAHVRVPAKNGIAPRFACASRAVIVAG